MVRRGWSVTVFGAALLLASCSIKNTNEEVKNADKAALASAGDSWNKLYSAQDWTGLRALYEDDAWLMTDKAPAFRNADEIVKYLQDFAGSGATVSFQFAPEDIVVDRPYGFVTAKYWMSANMPDGAEFKTAGRSFLVYKLSDGKWRLWRDIDNTSPDVDPDGPSTPTAS
jgi:ketosteroid isomerase-like protein